jgi:hypothetical protein
MDTQSTLAPFLEQDRSISEQATVHRALSHSLRIEILDVLITTTDGTLILDELVSMLENMASTSQNHDTLELALIHQHLPYLDQPGLIDWQRDTERITYAL